MKPTYAALEIRVLPWRPRRRKIDPDKLRDGVADVADVASVIDDLPGAVIGLGMMLVCYVAAPLVAIALAILLIPAELGIVMALAALLLLARFVGLIPWTVVVVDPAGADDRRERFRLLHRAVNRVLELNGGRRPKVVWHWV
ncbi:MAG: hypothetical protein AAGC49_13890 [Brevundimonas sp.]